MQTLSYGIKKPQTGDRGATLFTALEGNFEQQNDHSHDGIDSVQLSIPSLKVVPQSVSSAGWVSTVTGTWRQAVTLPAGYLYNDLNIVTRNAATGDPLLLTIEKINATSFYMYINDNSLNITVVYGL